jgi:cell pole-organizing protein PopZ
MTRTASSLRAVLIAAGCLGGCALEEMRTENERLGGQVRVKEDELQRERQTLAGLRGANRELLDDLQSREMTVAELGRRVQELQRLNAATAAATEAQRRQRAERQRQLAAAADDVRELQDAPRSSAGTPDAKAQQLQAKRRELRRKLELLANM